MNTSTDNDDKNYDLELEIAAFHQPAIDTARKMIFWAGFAYPLQPVLFFGMLARYFGTGVFATPVFAIWFAIGCAILGGHLALAWWAKRAPLPATSIALAVLAAYTGASTYLGYRPGWLWIIVAGFILVRAVMASYRVHKLRARHALQPAV